MNVSKTRLAIGTSLMALIFGMLGAGTAYAFQEHMFNVRNDLQQAVNEPTRPNTTKVDIAKTPSGWCNKQSTRSIKVFRLAEARPSR